MEPLCDAPGRPHLIAGVMDTREALESIFQFVRDEILFGFPPEGDFVKASHTIERGYGQCNPISTLFSPCVRPWGFRLELIIRGSQTRYSTVSLPALPVECH